MKWVLRWADISQNSGHVTTTLTGSVKTSTKTLSSSTFRQITRGEKHDLLLSGAKVTYTRSTVLNIECQVTASPVIRVSFVNLAYRRHHNFIFYMLCVLSFEESARKMFE